MYIKSKYIAHKRQKSVFSLQTNKKVRQLLDPNPTNTGLQKQDGLTSVRWFRDLLPVVPGLRFSAVRLDDIFSEPQGRLGSQSIGEPKSTGK